MCIRDSLDIVWTPETVARLFEIGPAAYTPGTKMPEQRIGSEADRAALVLAPVLLIARDAFPRDRKLWRVFFAMALLNNAIPWTLSFWAQQYIPSALAAILNAATPLFSVVVVHFMLADEKLRASRLAGVIVGLVGVAVLIGVMQVISVRRYQAANFPNGS